MNTENKIDTGGAAFACAGDTVSGSVGTEGMSLRDYFAAKAMQGLLASGDSFDLLSDIAKTAFKMADEMIAASKAGDA